MNYQYREYPKFLYHPSLAPQGKVLNSADETRGLARKEWVDMPAKFPKPSRLGTVAERYRRLGPFEKLGVWAGVASILGLLITVAAMLPGWLGPAGDLLVQTGTIQVRADVSDPTIDVYFPIAYETPPELTWLNMPYDFRVLEQRADGFQVKFSSSYSGVGPPQWRARGLRKRR
jgi:hypothetical protein